MKKFISTMCLLVLAVPALAATPSTTAPTEYLNPVAVPLTAKERKALEYSNGWPSSSSDVQPYMAGGGKLMYVHGASTPTIIAAPFQVSDVELEAGEIVNEIVVGDSARWMVESGTARDTTHLFIKPADSGLETSAVITTDRRVYHLRLVSQLKGHTPYVGFTYSDALRRTALQKKEQAKKEKEWQSTTNTEGRNVDLSKLNFNYEVDGRSAWKPERVYDDGLKTYIKLPSATRSGEMPALLVRKGDKDMLVNYRVQDSTMMVDGLFNTIALVAGVGGDQESVEIRRAK